MIEATIILILSPLLGIFIGLALGGRQYGRAIWWIVTLVVAQYWALSQVTP